MRGQNFLTIESIQAKSPVQHERNTHTAQGFSSSAILSIFFFLPHFLLMQLLFFLLVLFQDFLHNLLRHKPILHFRFGLAVLCIGAFLSFQKHCIHRANGAGLSARCARSFFSFAKDTFKRPPATRCPGIFQIFFCLSNPGNRILATYGAENFSFHSLQHCVLKFAKRSRQLFLASPTYYG